MGRWILSPTGIVTTIRLALGMVVLVVLGMPLWERLGLGAALREAFAPYCHQRVDRSLAIAGTTLPVCARCTGLWVGALFGAVLGRGTTGAIPRLQWLAWAAAPMAIDLALEHVFGTGPHAASRLLTGLCLGATLTCTVVPALVRAGEEIRGRCEAASSTSRAC